VKRVVKHAALAVVDALANGLDARFARLALAVDEDNECSDGCKEHDTTDSSHKNDERGAVNSAQRGNGAFCVAGEGLNAQLGKADPRHLT
jgi:hypothetical protein